MTTSDPKLMGGHLTLSIVTPEGAAFDGPADMVVVPAHDGEVAFLRGHAPYVGLLGVGELRFHEPEGGARHLFLSGGVVEVADDVVAVLAEVVAPCESIDVEKARADLAAAIALPAGDDAAAAAREKAMLVARAKIRLAGRSGAGARLVGGTGPRT